MGLGNKESAMLSAIIFNALILIALVPLALKGVKYVNKGALYALKTKYFNLWSRGYCPLYCH